MSNVVIQLGYENYSMPQDAALLLIKASMEGNLCRVEQKYIEGKYYNVPQSESVSVSLQNYPMLTPELIEEEQRKKDKAELQKLRDQVALLEASHKAPVNEVF